MDPIETRTNARSQRWCAIWMTVSVAIVLTGLVWGYHVGMQEVAVSHPLSHTREELAVLRNELSQLEAQKR